MISPRLFIAFTALAGALAAAQPNIVIIYADDLGFGDVGCYGATEVRTPHIDRLAREGLRFTSGYATASTCTQSRYSILTGEYAFRKKGTNVLGGDAALIIEPGRPTLASVLRAAGYRTSVIGKWHLGLGRADPRLDWNGVIAPGPLEVGFDECFILPATPDRMPCVYVENHRVHRLDPDDPIRVNYQNPFPGEPTYATEHDRLQMYTSGTRNNHNKGVINGIPRIGYMTGGRAAIWDDRTIEDTFVARAVEFIERDQNRPFFLHYCSHDIHVPHVPANRFVGRTTMGPRGDQIVEFDDAVGRILDTLDRLDLTDNTLVILTSDNGPVLDDGYLDGSVEKVGTHRPAGPFRGGKYSLYEGGTRVPFLVRWPGHVKPGRTTDAIVSQVDLIASFAALTGQPPPGPGATDSRNLLPTLLGQTDRGRDEVLEHTHSLSIRSGRWKYIEPVAGGLLLNGGNETGRNPQPQLYDLSVDPGEKHNLAADPAQADRVARLAAAIERERVRTPLKP
jgi:arylsulfatase A-like enzyme